MNARRWILALAVLGGVGGGFFLYRSAHRSLLPSLPLSESSPTTMAVGKIERLKGTVMLRLPSEKNLVPAKEGDSFPLKTIFQIAAQSSAQVAINGGWLVDLEGKGQFSLQDAKTNSDHTIHADAWVVDEGTFRIKPYDYDPSDFFLEVETPVSKVLVHKGEVGMSVVRGGGGQIWLMSGQGTVYRKDGSRKELPLKGLAYL